MIPYNRHTFSNNILSHNSTSHPPTVGPIKVGKLKHDNSYLSRSNAHPPLRPNRTACTYHIWIIIRICNCNRTRTHSPLMVCVWAVECVSVCNASTTYCVILNCWSEVKNNPACITWKICISTLRLNNSLYMQTPPFTQICTGCWREFIYRIYAFIPNYVVCLLKSAKYCPRTAYIANMSHARNLTAGLSLVFYLSHMKTLLYKHEHVSDIIIRCASDLFLWQPQCDSARQALRITQIFARVLANSKMYV